ncbi:hypothetical protein BDZ97DRAFT_1902227 [Flammula alnicola]|nr:hypothetical protein BDZ97DRAFT_1902227 [Flammula alnicola]
MRYHKNPRHVQTKRPVPATESPNIIPRTRQPYEAFLVLDLEGTCKLGTDFNYPNEIIEFPVSTFVKPTWRPTLSDFCTQLTGITQEQVDSAPPFSEALVQLEAFLVKNGLIDLHTKKRLKRFCWCSDGHGMLVEMPEWIRGDVLDVRSVVQQWKSTQIALTTQAPAIHISTGIRPSLNISAQLKVLGLPAFEGRQHSGIDDTRNIAKIVTELARRGVRLLPNTTIYPGRKWRWMGKHGQVLEDGLP